MPTHQRGTPSGSNRVGNRGRGVRSKHLFSFLVIALSISLLASVAGERFLMQVSRFLDQEALDSCNEAIIISDEDADGTIDSGEFATMVDRLTDGTLSVDEIAELPLRLRSIYFMMACMCALEPGAPVDCCIGDNASIPIEDLDVDDPSTANRVFCDELAKGISDVKDDLTPTEPPSTVPTSAPSMVVPTVSPPPETLCISFQYEIMNNQSLSADDIMNENGNSLKSGLEEATRTTVINILNETYPRTDGSSVQNPSAKTIGRTSADTSAITYVGPIEPSTGEHFRKLLQAAEQADAFELDMDLITYYHEMRGGMIARLNATASAKASRRLHYLQDRSTFLRQYSRRLVYYSDQFPVEISQVVDSTTCPGMLMNEAIRCAVVSSTVCVVLEPGDDPAEIRRIIIQGLEEAFRNGEFIGNIPPEATRR